MQTKKHGVRDIYTSQVATFPYCAVRYLDDVPLQPEAGLILIRCSLVWILLLSGCERRMDSRGPQAASSARTCALHRVYDGFYAVRCVELREERTSRLSSDHVSARNMAK